MKSFKKIFCCMVSLALAASVFCLFARAIEEEQQTLPPEYADFADAIPGETADRLPEGVFSENAADNLAAARELGSPLYLLTALLDVFGSRLSELLPTASLLLALLLLASLLNAISGTLSAGTGRAAELAVRLVSFATIIGIATSSLSRLQDYFSRLFGAVAAFLPLSGALYAMGGNLTAAASSTATLSVILSIVELVCTYTVIPLFCICLSLSLLSLFDGSGGQAGGTLAGMIKKNYLTVLSFVMMLLTASLGAQSILSAKADTAAMRGLKFAVSGFVPVTGGTVSSTLGTLSASVSLLRGSVGVIGIAVLLMLLLPTVVELALLKALFSVGGFLSGMLSLPGEQKLLNEVSGLYGLLEGVALLSAVVFIIAMGVFASALTAV